MKCYIKLWLFLVSGYIFEEKKKPREKRFINSHGVNETNDPLTNTMRPTHGITYEYNKTIYRCQFKQESEKTEKQKKKILQKNKQKSFSF